MASNTLSSESQNGENVDPELPLRRSSRQTAATTIVKTRDVSAETSTSSLSEPRRNPKRKAAEAARESINLPDNLLDEALRPLTPTDIEEWDGWVELESEPAFFNAILHDLGVQGVKVQELFSIDQSWIDTLPKPVYGLIFLFQYTPEWDDDGGEDETGSLWFANQTTSNACATFALLNIVMNAPHVQLGDQLRDFKEATKNLNTVLRGHEVSNNKFMRSIHNSFTRRMDHLNADLWLENAVSDTKTKKAKTASKSSKKANKKKRADDAYGFHFVAYVPVDGHVWELDGLQSKPHRVGPIESDDVCWTNIARPQIEGRILQYEESQISFNLLALCGSPLALHSRSIAETVASIRQLDEQMKHSVEYTKLIDGEKPPGFDKPEVNTEQDITGRKNVDDAYDLRQQFIVDTKVAVGEHRAEMISLAEDQQRVKDRKKDYGQALHRWVQKLAEKGILQEAIESS